MKQLEKLLEQPMDRKGFLKYMGAVLLTVIGVNGLIRTLTQHQTTHSSPKHLADPGTYGGSDYGGFNG